MIDLHTHSTASDGQLTPQQLAVYAHSKGLSAWALTDHDTTAGLEIARNEARRLDIDFIPGIELQIEYTEGEFHLLGLGLKDWTGSFQNMTQELEQIRENRNRIIFSKMQEAGISGSYDQIEEIAQGGQIGRPHFARFLVARGKVDSVQKAFDAFLARGKMFYEAKKGVDLKRAVTEIHKAGGLAIIAHPMSLYLTLTKLEPQLVQWKALGLDGLEAWHPGSPSRVCRKLEELAVKLDLKVSAGSDFHGDRRKDRQLGRDSDGKPISDLFLEKLFIKV